MKIVNGQCVFILELTQAQLAVLQEGVMSVPYGRAAPVVAAVNEQLRAQQAESSKKTEAGLMAEHHGRYVGDSP